MFWSFRAFIPVSVKAECGLLDCDSLSLKGSQQSEPRAMGSPRLRVRVGR